MLLKYSQYATVLSYRCELAVCHMESIPVHSSGHMLQVLEPGFWKFNLDIFSTSTKRKIYKQAHMNALAIMYLVFQ